MRAASTVGLGLECRSKPSLFIALQTVSFDTPATPDIAVQDQPRRHMSI